MRTVAVYVALLLALTGCTTASPGDDPARRTNPPSDAAQPPPTDDSGAVVAKTELDIRGTCRPRARRENGQLALLADLDVVNTGNVGVQARVTVTWPRAPFARVETFRNVSVEQGQTAPLTVRLAVSRRDAAGVARAIEHGRRCKVRHRITGAFGSPTG
jgi:hypothetical protein